MYRFKVIFMGVLLALGSCAPARFVEPLKKGQQVLTGNFGGPVAKIPGIGSIPIPFTAVGFVSMLSTDLLLLLINFTSVPNVDEMMRNHFR